LLTLPKRLTLRHGVSVASRDAEEDFGRMSDENQPAVSV
jgi:hypothetical protein